MTKLTRESMQKSHAVVIGGSLAGMFAARVLANFYQRVTVLDRDQFPAEPDHRKGVPQSQHAHALLVRGQQIIESHFPGITEQLKAQNATLMYGDEFRLVAPYGELAMAQPEDEEAGVFVSRFMLEWFVRDRLRQLENVTLYDSVEVLEPLTNHDKTAITGVLLAAKGASPHGLPTELSADFVVDASGRRSKSPQWLTQFGYDAPPEESINSQIGYASRFYRKPEGFSAEWKGIIINARVPDNAKAGLILPIEDDKWHVTMGGFAGHYPPTDEDGFMQWAKDLPDPAIYDALQDAEPLTPLRGYRTPSNRLRHFEKLSHMPSRFIVLGDAVCAFNPIYGQGMTTSAIGSQVLQQALNQQVANPKTNFEQRFQKALAKSVADPWFIATSEDLRWEGVAITGAKPSRMAESMRPYLNQLLKTARHDTVVATAYFDMINMMRRPQSLFRPNIAWRVIRDWLRGDGVDSADVAPSKLQTTNA